MKFILEERFILNEAEEGTGLDGPTGETGRATDTSKTAAPALTWEQRYEACETSEDYKVFWDGGRIDPRDPEQKGYFKEVWGNYATEIKGLGSDFLETLVKIGWTAEDNPFVAYLENNIKLHKQVMPTMPSMKLLIKLYTNRQLSGADLRGVGKLKNYNLVYNKSLYLAAIGDQEAYLTAQANFSQKCTKGYPDLGTAFANIYSAAGNLKDLTKPVAEPSLLSLRSAKDVRRIVARELGEDAGALIEITDKQITNILNQVTDQKTAKKALAYLYDIFNLLDPQTLQKANKESDNYITAVKNENIVKTAESNAFKTLFGLPQTTYKADLTLKLLQALIAKAKGNT